MGNTETDISALADHLFRHESGKLVAVMTRIFGATNLDLAEDVVQDALLDAVSQWKYKGVPENPVAWLYKVARNKAINIVNREKYKRQYSSEMAPQSEYAMELAMDHLFSARGILDDQVRMMFTCCHPSISPDSQVALTLKTLCGFSTPEIAKAFITNEENINKRLVRAKQKIRKDKIGFIVPKGHDLEERLAAVLETIYLLFNEGYAASQGDSLIRYELCEEAIRIAGIIASHPSIINRDNVYALLSLMLLNASRFKSRLDKAGMIVEMEEQNRALWDREMIQKGVWFLSKALYTGTVSKYHILAAISAHHCTAASIDTTYWEDILSLYDNLLQLDNSAIVLLNRAVVVAKVSGVPKAIHELEKLKTDPLIKNYQYYYSTLAELYLQQKRFTDAKKSFTKAIALSTVPSEKKALQGKLNFCRSVS